MELNASELQKIMTLDAIQRLEDAISYARQALVSSFERTTAEACRGESEQYLVQGVALMHDARDALCAAAEAES